MIKTSSTRHAYCIMAPHSIRFPNCRIGHTIIHCIVIHVHSSTSWGSDSCYCYYNRPQIAGLAIIHSVIHVHSSTSWGSDGFYRYNNRPTQIAGLAILSYYILSFMCIVQRLGAVIVAIVITTDPQIAGLAILSYKTFRHSCA